VTSRKRPEEGWSAMQLRAEDAGSITAAVIPLEQRLLQAVGRLSDADVQAPSRLPGWTVATSSPTSPATPRAT